MEFRLPDLGEGIAEGEIMKWLVKQGDMVKEHQPIVEVETDKALVQVPSPVAGKLVQIAAKSGKVHVGDVLCVIGEDKVDSKAKPKKGSSTVIGELEEAPDEDGEVVKTPSAPKKAVEASVSVLPAVRKLAQEMNVDLASVKGTGPNGRITEDDVRRSTGKSEKAPSGPRVTFEKFGRVLRVALKGVRKTIAENMVNSLQTAAHVTHMDYIDVTALNQLREKEKVAAEGKGVHLTFMPFIIKACVMALKEFPYMNSSIDEQTSEIVIKQYYNIGVAVDTPHGLMVPVIKSPNEKSIIEIGREIYRVAELARSREIELKDLQGGTFTITNVGSLGGVFATPIINYPEVAILATGRIMEMPAVVDGKIVVRKMLPVSLSFDHRVVDGALAARFVNEVKRRLEDPDALLVGY